MLLLDGIWHGDRIGIMLHISLAEHLISPSGSPSKSFKLLCHFPASLPTTSSIEQVLPAVQTAFTSRIEEWH